MPELLIHLRKKPDGSVALSCQRQDGSMTWGRQDRRRETYFPLRDLTHYAVETELGLRRGTYGLVVEGWDLTDFLSPYPRGPLPIDADPAEVIVEFFEGERNGGRPWTVDDLNHGVERYQHQRGAAPAPLLTGEQVARIRMARARLLAQWGHLLAGDTLTLTFDRKEA